MLDQIDLDTLLAIWRSHELRDVLELSQIAILIANNYLQLKQWQEAYNYLETAYNGFKQLIVTGNPENKTDFQLQFAYTAMLLGNYYLNQQPPNTHDAYFKYDDAEKTYRELGCTEKRLLASIYKTNCLFMQRDHESAKAMILNTLQEITIIQYKIGIFDPTTAPKDPELRKAFEMSHVTLSKIYYAENTETSISLAEKSFQIVTKISEEYTNILKLNKAQSLHNRNLVQEAKVIFLSINQNLLMTYDKFFFFYEFAHCFWQDKQLDKAIEYLHYGLNLNIKYENKECYISLGLMVCYYEKNAVDIAENFFSPLKKFLDTGENSKGVAKQCLRWKRQDGQSPPKLHTIFELADRCMSE